jgi:hypothetical protein
MFRLARAPSRPDVQLTPQEHANIEKWGKGLKLNSKYHAARKDIIAARKQALHQVKNVPQPSDEDVAANVRHIQEAHRAGGELRGNSTDRARSRRNIFHAYGGDEKGHVPCAYCGLKLHHTDDAEENPQGFEKLEREKILTGHEGGRYTLGNLLPSCHGCNSARGDKESTIGIPAWKTR